MGHNFELTLDNFWKINRITMYTIANALLMLLYGSVLGNGLINLDDETFKMMTDRITVGKAII